MFQSLFFWNGLWDYYVAGGWSDGEQFQSLFFWNGLWDDTGSGAARPYFDSFNPCFSGMAFGTSAALTSGFPRSRSFNPCFSGMAFGTIGADVGMGQDPLFQSLFFWNGLWDCANADAGGLMKLFQSLFFWNGLWDDCLSRPGGLAFDGFNPCFSGMAFGTSRPGRPTRAGRVSILVFLEWPLGPTLVDNYYVDVVSFNPCFSGMAFGTTKRQCSDVPC